jgi:hypothetical protein
VTDTRPPDAAPLTPEDAAARPPEEAPPSPPARRGRGGCLIAVALLVLILALGVGGCVYSCYGTFKGAYKVGVWGWVSGAGPRLQSVDTTRVGTPAQPQDRAQPDAVKDREAEQALVRIHAGLLAFRLHDGRPYDPARDGGLARALAPYVRPWPANPWTGLPMREGVHRGDVQFGRSADGLDLTVYVSP